MSDSDDDNVLYASRGQDSVRQGKGLITGGSKRLDDVMNGPTDGRRLKKTIALCGSFIGLGLAAAVVGPTLHELQDHLSTDLPHISFIFTGRSIGYVIGSILGGLLFEYFHPLMLISVTLAISGIGLMTMPQYLRLGPTIATISLVGVATGALDTGTNVVILRLWGKKSAPFMQALHFSFAIRAFISPLLASPFIGTHSNLTEIMSTNVAINLSASIAPVPDLSDANDGSRRKRSAADLDFQDFTASGENGVLYRGRLKRGFHSLETSRRALHKNPLNPEHGRVHDENENKILEDAGFNHDDDFLENKWTQPLKSRRVLEENSQASDASKNDTNSVNNSGGPQNNTKPPNDAGDPSNDAGDPPNNAGDPPNDAGDPPNDAGDPPNDAGDPPNDAG